MAKKSSRFVKPILLVILIVTILGSAAPFLFQKTRSLSPQKAGEKAVAYIKETMQLDASLVDAVEESGIYKITLKIQDQEFPSYVSKDGRFLFPNAIDLEMEPEVAGEQTGETPEYPKTVGDFLVLDKEECFENEKPLVYFFGNSDCPHCKWEEPVMRKVTDKFGDLIAFHNNMDTQEDGEVFDEYSAINGGGVPFLILGCKYARVGSGEQAGEDEEIKALTTIICQLTDGAPKEICDEVEVVDD